MDNIRFQTLSTEEVLNIHYVLVEDFSNGEDPIEPSGIRDNGALLESAVHRQYVGLGNEYKYPTPIINAASLCYGICCNHAFHNGNKRTALVSLLCHLDKNNFTLKQDVKQDRLYRLMLKIASHGYSPKKRGIVSDVEVQGINNWLIKNTRKLSKGEKVVTYRELRKILREYKIEFENPKNNYIDVIKYTDEKTGIFRNKELVGRRVCHIPYSKEGMVVGKGVLRSIRRECGLTVEQGYDKEMFYGSETSVDKFVVKYKNTLKKLAKN